MKKQEVLKIDITFKKKSKSKILKDFILNLIKLFFTIFFLLIFLIQLFK